MCVQQTTFGVIWGEDIDTPDWISMTVHATPSTLIARIKSESPRSKNIASFRIKLGNTQDFVGSPNLNILLWRQQLAEEDFARLVHVWGC